MVSLLDAVQDVSAGNAKIPQSAFREIGALSVVDQGQALIAGYTDDMSAAVKTDSPVIVFGDHTRALKFVDFPFAMGADGVKVLRVREGFDPKYVFHALLSTPIPSAGYSRHFKFLKEIRVPQPPLDEQRRIAAILDHADALRAKRRQVLAHLDALPQAIFNSMFRESNVPSLPLGDVVADLQGGKSLVASDSTLETTNRVLKISAVTTNHFRPDESKPLPDEYEPPESHFVRQGDLLFSRANTTELVGAVALVEHSVEGLVLPDKLWRFVWADPEGVDPVYAWSMLQTREVRRELSRRSSGTGGSMKNIAKSKLLSMPVPWAGAKEQERFGRRVRAVHKQRSAAASDARFADELFASLQARAFRGEL